MLADSASRQAEIEETNEPACPVVHAVETVGTPWRLHVVYALRDGELRFNDLKRATEARSKTLSAALDELVDAGVVERRMEEDAPVAVYYRLSETGHDLVAVLADLGEWARVSLDGAHD